MRQTTKQTKTYQAPTVKVVQFMIERGFAPSAGYTEDGENNSAQYEEIEATSSNSNPGWGIFQ